MNDPVIFDYRKFIIPVSIVTRVDVARLVRDFERVDNELTMFKAKQGVGMAGSEVAVSPQLADFLALNKLQPKTSAERTALVKQLRLLKNAAPVMHMTFASETDEETLQYLTQWLRQSIHPQAVVSVGLQPNLVAGVHIRTQNKMFDFSLRSQLQAQRGVLVKELESIRANI